MEFIELFSVLHSLTVLIQPEQNSGTSNLFVSAGKISQRTANEFRARVAPGIDLANRVAQAARSLIEALQFSAHEKPKIFEYDDKTAVALPAKNDAWSKIMALLFQARLWGVREELYCLSHFNKAKAEGEGYLHRPIHRHETDGWLYLEGNAYQRTLLGFDGDELFPLLDANRVRYTRQSRRTILNQGGLKCMKKQQL
ncbi:MAG: hypothetical protein P4L42_02130 [Desulfocapsaceae bacterium]|nr:hypothetical protein [Desulfocapsaceae bacterium]